MAGRESLKRRVFGNVDVEDRGEGELVISQQKIICKRWRELFLRHSSGVPELALQALQPSLTAHAHELRPETSKDQMCPQLQRLLSPSSP